MSSTSHQYKHNAPNIQISSVPLKDGQEKLQELVHLPRTWPLARLTIPLEGLSKQIDRLLEGYCFQILATNRNPEAHNGMLWIGGLPCWGRPVK